MRRMGCVSEELTAVPLHRRPDLLEACADLINEEWKRSRTSRIHSLQRSTDSFPLCLVLMSAQRAVQETAEGKMAKSQCQLIGHARLSRVVGQPLSLFVETVVVSKALRGKGYGRKLMEAVESYTKSRGYKQLHLTTHDKQHFYAHLGYILSKPVQCAGFMSSLVPMEFLEIFSPPQHDQELHVGSWKRYPSASCSPSSGASLSPPLPPPASHPLLHPSCSSQSLAISPQPQLSVSLSSHTSSFQPADALVHPSPLPSVPFSAGCLSAANLPPPPPPPPPPPLPPPPSMPPTITALLGHPNSCPPVSSSPSENKIQGQPSLETPYRDLKGLPVFWMEKDI